MALSGVNFVRFTRHGLQAIRAYWARTGDRFEVRRQALKLRFWDERHLHLLGMLFDHSYESIKALPKLGIHELRVDDAIGGQSNIRIVFLIRLRIGSPRSASYVLSDPFGFWKRCRSGETIGRRTTLPVSEPLGC